MRITKLDYENIERDEMEYANKISDSLNALYGYNAEYDIISALTEEATVFFARDSDNRIRGVLVATKFYDIFTEEHCLYQRLFFADTPRASGALFKHFVDYGKSLGQPILCVLTPHTNLKEENLLKRGFSKYETIFKLKG